MKKLIGLCLSLILTIISVMPSSASTVGIGEVIGNIYSTDILATINGIPIPSYSIGGKTAIVVEDLRYYGSTVIYDNNTRTLNVNLAFGGTTVSGLPAERGQVGTIAGNILKTDIITNFRYGPLSGYIAVPSYAIDGRMCVAIEDLGDLIPGISYKWDGAGRVIELIISNDFAVATSIVPLQENDFSVYNGQYIVKLDLPYSQFDFNLPEEMVDYSANNFIGEVWSGDFSYKYYYHYYPDFIIHTSNQDYNLKNRTVNDYYITQIILRNSNFKTYRGIGIDSDVEDVYTAYGHNCELIKLENGMTDIYYLLNDMVIHFYIGENEKVAGISFNIVVLSDINDY